MTTVGRTALVRIRAGVALEAKGSDAVRPWRVPALIMWATLACIAALALATLPALTAPSTHPLTSLDGAALRAVERP